MKKKYLLLISLLMTCAVLLAQTPQSFKYQAVLRNTSGEPLYKKTVELKISILEASADGIAVYSELHKITTNMLGMVNFNIGTGESLDDFAAIEWETSQFFLKVEMAVGSNGHFVEIGTSQLLSVPYAFHSATAMRLVPEKIVKKKKKVKDDGVPSQNWSLFGNSKTDPDKDKLGTTDSADLVFVSNNKERLRITAEGKLITADGVGLDLGGNLKVRGDSVNIDKDLFVGRNVYLNVNDEFSPLGQTINNGKFTSYGQVSINTTLSGGAGNFSAYPLKVEGSNQGIAIKVNAGTPDNSNNFITFFNNSNGAVGRIEGETAGEKALTAEFIFETALLTAEVVAAGVNIGLSLLPNGCAGVGVVACPPEPSVVAIAIAEEILAIANLAAYEVFAFTNLGVTYQSGSADYAEWLERLNPAEIITPGDIVGVIGGKVTKNTNDVNQYLIASTNPAILGNMPEPGQTKLYEKIAFMGQVPVKVRGKVKVGDYIIPSGLHDGSGIAISPEFITAEQYTHIVGIAWTESQNYSISFVNMSIGLNNNDVAKLVIKQQNKIANLEKSFASLEKRLAKLESGSSLPEGKIITKKPVNNLLISSHEEPLPEELDVGLINDAILNLEDTYRAKGIDIDSHPGLKKLFNDEKFRLNIIKKVNENYKIGRRNFLKM
ncbi:MAG: hypothetical protein ABFS35_12780 [Bacteroidota bacterium]